MPRNKILSEYEKEIIEQWWLNGISKREISVLTCQSKKVISNYFRNKETYGKNCKGG